MDADLRSEYDLGSLRVRKVGPKRKNFRGQTETEVTTLKSHGLNLGTLAENNDILILPENAETHEELFDANDAVQRNADMTVQGRDFKALRQWDGSQYRAFEELCYQLRDPTPEGAKLVKTGNPDGGLEWYVPLWNGVQWGWQAKFTFEIGVVA